MKKWEIAHFIQGLSLSLSNVTLNDFLILTMTNLNSFVNILLFSLADAPRMSGLIFTEGCKVTWENFYGENNKEIFAESSWIGIYEVIPCFP